MGSKMKSIVCLLMIGMLLGHTSQAYAEPGVGDPRAGVKAPTGEEVLAKSHKLRFVVPESWHVMVSEGIYTISSSDKKLLMVMVLLDKPEEVSAAMLELDQMVVVSGAAFSEPWNDIQGAIPMQYRAGRGQLQPSDRPVELLSVVMNVVKKPVVVMFYVHESGYASHLPMIKEVLSSFALLLSPVELEAVKKMTPPGGSGTRE